MRTENNLHNFWNILSISTIHRVNEDYSYDNHG
jgi:hypothetical protein